MNIRVLNVNYNVVVHRAAWRNDNSGADAEITGCRMSWSWNQSQEVVLMKPERIIMMMIMIMEWT